MTTIAPTLAVTVADLAEWLATRDQPAMPPLVGSRIDRDCGRLRIQLQLAPAGFAPVLDDLADWAEHLGATITLERDFGGHVRASITTALRHGQRVELWNYLEFPQLRALDAAGISLDGVDPVTVTQLRAVEAVGVAV